MCEHTQKITEALYRITDVFPDREPLKWYLRKEGLSIFKIFLNIQDSSTYERIRYVDKIESIIPHMIHGLELASLGTFISRINFEVLSREYNALLDFVKANKEELLPESEKKLSVMSFGERLLKEKDNQIENEGEKVNDAMSFRAKNDVESNGHFENENKEELSPDQNNETASLNTQNNDSFHDQNQKNEDERSPIFFEHSRDRHKKILSILEEKGEVSVSDVSLCFGGLSEKTIQRDLAHLIDQGAVKKYGDKRWRRYVLNGTTY